MILREALSFPWAETLEKRLDRKLPAVRGGAERWTEPISDTPVALSCTAASQPDVQARETTHTRARAQLFLPSSGKMTVQIFMKYFSVLSQPCMDTCKLLPSWIGKCVFPLEFQTESAIPDTLSMRSRQKWTGSMHVDTWLCTNCETWEPFWVLQSHSMLHSPPDSMQTTWQMLPVSSMGKEYRCTNKREICLPSLHKAKPVDSQYITNSAWLFKLRSLTRIRLWNFFFFKSLGQFFLCTILLP